MALIIELSPEVEAQLEQEAENRGISLSDLARDTLLKLVAPPPAKSVAEMDSCEYLIHLAKQFQASVPEEEWTKVPPDFAKNYEHYRHGNAKSEE